MLPDFPSLKRKLVRAIDRYLRSRVRNQSLIGLIQHEVLFEGDRLLVSRPEGQQVHEIEEHASEEYTIPQEELIRRGPAALFEVVQRMAEDLQREQSRTLLEAMREATEAAGQVVKGRPFDFDVFMEAMDKIDIEFDENGEPHTIYAVLHPDAAKQIPSWEANAEYNARYEELIGRKRLEWDARESNRKLVD